MEWQQNSIAQKLNAPAAASDPACFAWERNKTQHILYLGKDDQVHELWQRKGKEWAYGGALSQLAGGPPAAGKPMGYAWESDNTQHVLYLGKDGRVNELWQRENKKWEYGGAINVMVNAPNAVGSPFGYAWESDDTQHILYRAADNQIHELWQRKGKPWEHGGAISQITGATLAAGDPVGYAWEEDKTQHIVYLGKDHQIHELWQRKGEKWQHGGALSRTTGGPDAISTPSCYAWGRDGTQHILYRGEDEQIHEIWYRKKDGWKYGNALSQLAAGPSAASDPSGYAWEGDNTQHVLYVGADQQVHELWQRKGKEWLYGGALSQKTGSVSAVGVPAGFAWEDDDTQHIVYRGADDQIHELWQRK
jgi:hypothetical protein